MANRLEKHVKSAAQLRITNALELGTRAINTIPVRAGLPWNDFAKIYSLKLGVNEPVIVAQRTGGVSYDVVFIHRCKDLSQIQAELLQCLQHENLTTIHELYLENETWHIATEQVARSLQEAVGNPFLDSSMVAAIIGQIVTALVYLEDMGLVSRITCSDVLLHASGRVKLGRHWNCVYSDTKEDIRRLGSIMMELMDGHVKESGSVGLDNPARWSHDALHFLGATTSASSAKELLKHPFLASWRMEKLQGVISLIMTRTTQNHHYLGPES